MANRVLSNRALNRATLARQMLLQRADIGIVDAVDFLVGLQGQVTDAPYQALWSRLRNFRHEDLTALIIDRTLLRATSLRATLHLQTIGDLVGLRPLVQPTLDRMWKSAFGNRRFGGHDIADVHRAGVELLKKGPMTGGALGKALQEQFPSGDAQAKAVLLQIKEILIQIPPTRIWGSGHAPLLTRIEDWVPKPHLPPLDKAQLVLRYLRAFGPASINDMQAWSGMTRLASSFEAVSDQLMIFEGEDGRPLYDLPDAPRPDAATPAPVRFLPDYDNVLIGYSDRSRIVSEADIKHIWETGRSFRAVLVDGVVAASWSLVESTSSARLTVTPLRKLLKREAREIETEGAAFLRFMAPEREGRVEVTP